MSKLKNIIRKFVFRYIKPPVKIIDNSYSQAGEDRIVEYLFSSMGINEISYIDIGANDPVNGNNTYHFYNKNNKGVLVEPDSIYHNRMKETRPDDLLINAAISDEENEKADLYVFDVPALNTLSKEEADQRIRSGVYKLIEKRRIEQITIETIIKKYLKNRCPELISLDVEGVDYKVLNSFDFEKYPVPVWIVETCAYSETHIKPKVTSIIDLMLSKGYFVFADTYINTVFVKNSWFENYNAG
jgi:FkbM family methyltransferase